MRHVVKRCLSVLALSLALISPAAPATALAVAAARPTPPAVDWQEVTCSYQRFTITEPAEGGAETYMVFDANGNQLWELSLPPGGSDTLTYSRPPEANEFKLVVTNKFGQRVGRQKLAWPDCPKPAQVSWAGPTCGSLKAIATVAVPDGGLAGVYSLLGASANLAAGDSATLAALVKSGTNFQLRVMGPDGTVGEELAGKLDCPAALASSAAAKQTSGKSGGFVSKTEAGSPGDDSPGSAKAQGKNAGGATSPSAKSPWLDGPKALPFYYKAEEKVREHNNALAYLGLVIAVLAISAAAVVRIRRRA